MSSEQHARTRIDAQLHNEGWRLDGVRANVMLGGDCKTEEQKRRLNPKQTDYILYKTDSTHPLAVIEAKKLGTKNLDDALDQGMDYAKRLGADFVIATDSFVVKMKDANGDIPTIDGEPINRLLSEEMLLRLQGDIHFKTEKSIIKNRGELISLFNRSQNLLRQDGVDAGMDSIYEFCSLLFIKIMSETSNKIPDLYRWDSLTKYNGQDLLIHYGNTIGYFKANYVGIFREIKIKSPRVLEGMIESLKNINLSDVDIDIKGEAYEHFLKRYSAQNRSVLGQHFTPRHITDMMTLLLNPQIDEKIYDPFCGTGGMLLSCYKEIRRNIDLETDVSKLNADCLYGNDISFGPSQLAKMNMVLVGDGHSNITNKDSMKLDIAGEYDCVITNIPFNIETGTNENFVKHCFNVAKHGGRACIIIPETMAYDPEYTGFRKYVAETCKIEAVIRLPRQTFKAYTTARACILWVSGIRKEDSKSVIYVDVHNDGFSDSIWREPILDSDIPKILENKDALASIYGANPFDDAYTFFGGEEKLDHSGEYSLAELLVVKKEKQPLEPHKEYHEVRLSSKTNTTHVSRTRLGKNIKEDKKVMVKKGDLVIGTLHTQQGNGLFAISDGDYIATSQIVAEIRTDLISPEYLTIVLRSILPKLRKNDLTGRETYKKRDILSLRIPAEPSRFRQDLETLKKLERDKEALDQEIEKIIGQYSL